MQVLASLEGQQPSPCSSNANAVYNQNISTKWTAHLWRAHLTLQINAFFISSPVILLASFLKHVVRVLLESQLSLESLDLGDEAQIGPGTEVPSE